MKTRIALFFFSFLLGLYLWFPYRTIYSGLIDRMTTEIPLTIYYSIDHASLTGVTLKDLRLKYNGFTIKEDALSIKINPLGFLVSRDLFALKKKGLFLKIGYRKPLYYVQAVINQYKDPNLDGTTLSGSFALVVDRKTGLLKSGVVDITAEDLKINASSLRMGFKKIILKGSIKEGIFEIKRLTAYGDINAQITGRLVQDVNNFGNSRLNLEIRYQIGKQSLSTTYRARLGQLLNMHK